MDSLGRQSILWVNVPFGSVALVALVRGPPGSRSPVERRADVVGQLLFVAAMASPAHGPIEAGAEGRGAPVVLGSFAVAAVTLIAFVRRESRQDDPTLPMGLFRSPALVVAGAVDFLGLFGLYGSIFPLTFHLRQVNGLSTVETGVRLPAPNPARMLFSCVASILAAEYGPKIPILIGSAAGMIALFALTVLALES